MMNKKAIQLSMNFLVTIIIAVVLFSLGIKFAYDLFAKAESLEEMNQKELDQRIEDLFCSSNELFCLSTTSKTIERGDSWIFTVNVHNVRIDRRFILKVELVSAFTEDNQIINVVSSSTDPVPAGSYTMSYIPDDNGKEFNLGPNDDEKTALRIEVPKENKKGTYVFDVSIIYENPAIAGEWKDYDYPKKLYVNVPN